MYGGGQHAAQEQGATVAVYVFFSLFGGVAMVKLLKRSREVVLQNTVLLRRLIDCRSHSTKGRQARLLALFCDRTESTIYHTVNYKRTNTSASHDPWLERRAKSVCVIVYCAVTSTIRPSVKSRTPIHLCGTDTFLSAFCTNASTANNVRLLSLCLAF